MIGRELSKMTPLSNAPNDNVTPWRKSEKFQAAISRLPKELHDAYEQLVADYSFATMKKYGRGYVAYEVLADLILVGWRPPEA